MCIDGSVQRRSSSADSQDSWMPAADRCQSLLLRPVQFILHSTSGDRRPTKKGKPPVCRARRVVRRRRRHSGGRRQSARSSADLGRLPVLLVLPAEASRVDHRRTQLPASTAELSSTTRPDRQGVCLCRSHPRLSHVKVRGRDTETQKPSYKTQNESI